MSTRTTIFPTTGYTPRGYISPMGGIAGIPVLLLDGASDVDRTNVHMECDSIDLDEAVRYLDELADAASSLAAKVRVQQQSLRLLEAVESSPGTAGAL